MIHLAFLFCMLNKFKVIKFMECPNKSSIFSIAPKLLPFLLPAVVVAASFHYRFRVETAFMCVFRIYYRL